GGWIDTKLIYHKSNGVTCGTYQWPVTIEKTPKIEAISIFPNPAGEMLNISIPGNKSECYIHLIDMMGKTIMQVASDKETIIIPVDNVRPGIYNVSIRLKEMLYHRKIAVSH